MPITITPSATQTITINTTYSLTVAITDDPDTVEVKGLLEGFYYSYENGTLTIAGEATRLISNAVWTITAKKGSETVTDEIIYNVVPPAPIIATVEKQFIARGTPFSLDVPIENSPGNVTVTGHILGLKSDGTNPLNISGTVPIDAEFTVDSGEFNITAQNAGGEDTKNVEWEFERFLLGVDSGDDQVYVFSNNIPDGERAVATRVFNFPSNLTQPTGAATDGNDLYIFDTAGREVFVIPADTANRATATVSRRFVLNNLSTFTIGITVDENHFYVVEGNGYVYVYDKLAVNNARVNPIRSFRFIADTIIADGLTHDGTNLYIAYYDSGTNYIAVVPANTADGGTATILRRFQFPQGMGSANTIVIHRNDVYSVTIQNKVVVFPKETADGSNAVASRVFDVPTGATGIAGLGIA